MATGDADDFAARLRAALPRRWFPVAREGEASPTPVLDAILAGLGTAWASVWQMRAFVIAQARILTASGVWLDFIAADFFARGIVRRPTESDIAFRGRIRRALFRERGTRGAIASILTEMTGRAPWIFEPRHPPDTGGWGAEGMTMGTGLGYGMDGGWGSLELPWQCFVVAYRPLGDGVGNVAGYHYGSGWGGGGFGVGAVQWISQETFAGALTDADIYEAVARTMPAATVAWTGIDN